MTARRHALGRGRRGCHLRPVGVATSRRGSWRVAITCPFHRAEQWRDLRDHAIRSGYRSGVDNAELRAVGACLHRSCGPLEEVDLSTPEERGQLNLFESDCQSGVCGL
jgi:hypothetical protein